MNVDIWHSHRSSSRLSCDSSVRGRRRNIWVSCSFMRGPATTRRRACLGEKRMNRCIFVATLNYVTNGFLPAVVWVNLSFPVFYHSAVQPGVLSTVLRRSYVGHCERRLLASTFGCDNPAAGVDYPVSSKRCTVLHRLRICPSKLRLPATAFGSSLSVIGVDHPFRGVLCTILHLFRTCHSIRWNLDAQPSFLHLLWLTLTIPSKTCLLEHIDHTEPGEKHNL